ncbi:MAG: hypothetical protein JWQ01_4631 [Massilia sp.]|nr:hypothetical protein [Massilia sp.]
MFFKNKQQQQDASGDQLARTIANQIILWQQLLATKLNMVINRHTKRRQKWLLFIFCGVSAGCLALCLLVPFEKRAMIMPGHNYQPAHIGLPSDLPLKRGHLPTTDSLTTKK